MGMFDPQKFLTAKEAGRGYVEPGDTFWLHNARVEPDGKAKLKVSHTRDGEQEIVYSSGKGIVGQISRMDADDFAAFPIEVRLDQLPPRQSGHSPTNVLTPANMPPATASVTGGDVPDF